MRRDFMMWRVVFLIWSAVVACPMPVSAGLVFFNLRDAGIESLEGSASMVLNDLATGLEVTLRTELDGIHHPGNVFNRTSSGFGINAFGSGDDTDTLDGALGIEAVRLTFSHVVRFELLGLSSFSGAEAARLGIGSFPDRILSDRGSSSDVYEFTSSHRVDLGETVLLEFSGGNGFSFDNFGVTIESVSVVPEPSSWVLGVMGGVMVAILFCIRRRATITAEPSV